MNVGQIQRVKSEIDRAIGLVGETEFTRRVEAVQYTDWPRRHTQSDDIFARQIQTHIVLVRQDVAREILATEYSDGR